MVGRCSALLSAAAVCCFVVGHGHPIDTNVDHRSPSDDKSYDDIDNFDDNADRGETDTKLHNLLRKLLDRLPSNDDNRHLRGAASFKLLIQLKQSSTVNGVALLDGRTYSVRQGSTVVSIFDAKDPYGSVGEIDVSDMKMATDMTADNKKRVLYVADLSMRIWRIDVGTKAVTELMKTNYSPKSLSFSASSNQLVVVAMGSRKLYVYDVADIGATLSSTVQLPDYVDPQHAVKTAEGHYLVAHKGASPADRRHDQVTAFDAYGEVGRSYGGWRGSDEGQLQMPSHLAVTGDGGVMVADGKNGRVVRLNAGLEYVELVAVDAPFYRLSLADNEDRLIAAITNTVGVYGR